MVAPFGTSLHVSGRDAAALEAAIAPYRQQPEHVVAAVRRLAGRRLHRSDGPRQGQRFNEGKRCRLSSAPASCGRSAPCRSRYSCSCALRDRVTFATMVTIPLLQLMLFGYAINTNPRHLPTAVLLGIERRRAIHPQPSWRTPNTSRWRTNCGDEEPSLIRCWLPAPCCSPMEIPLDFERALRRR